MYRYIFLLFFFNINTLDVKTQPALDSVFIQILKNNKRIQRETQYWKFKNLEFDVALNMDDPKVEFDYLFGSPSSAGNQKNIYVTQEIDFPSVYGKRRQLRREQGLLADHQLRITRQEILWEVKDICIELVYRNKLDGVLSARKNMTEKWLSHFLLKLDKGEGQILDVQKAKIRLVDLQSASSENKNAIFRLHQRLKELNGGIMITYRDTVYPLMVASIAMDEVQNLLSSNDPYQLYLAQNKKIGQKELELTKAFSYPKFEFGYYNESILGQTFQGVHLGSTIPLWANKNKRRAQQAQLVLLDLKLDEYSNTRQSEIAQLMEEKRSMLDNLHKYKTLLDTLKNMELLEKALAFGEISSMEYFVEMNYYHEVVLNYLKMEMELYKADAALLRFVM